VHAHSLRSTSARAWQAQRIGGEAALSLPAAECKTVWLDMNASERGLYRRAEQMDGRALLNLYLADTPAAQFNIDNAMLRRRQACANTYISTSTRKGCGGGKNRFTDDEVRAMASLEQNTKLQALRDDLRALVREDAHAHAVIFTHHVPAHARLSQLCKAEGFDVFEVTGSTAGEKRHEAIRAFQRSGERRVGRPAAFVITVKTGAVGITLYVCGARTRSKAVIPSASALPGY
jgi:SNF2 family DNA or RNA helicase